MYGLSAEAERRRMYDLSAVAERRRVYDVCCTMYACTR